MEVFMMMVITKTLSLLDYKYNLSQVMVAYTLILQKLFYTNITYLRSDGNKLLWVHCKCDLIQQIQGDSNMTGTDLCVNSL
jgi:hypothetical protein